MFEWLEQEIAAVKTPRFHMVDGPADARLRKAIEGAPEVLVPDSYREFVLKFGNAKLYRNARNNGYTVGVFASPKTKYSGDGTLLYHLGFNDGARAYIKPHSNSKNIIYEYEEEEEQVADSFEQWLAESCARARKRYARQWPEILAGPRPFTEQEKEIIEARRTMRWKVLGIDAGGNHIVEVRNLGLRSLSTLTIGARSKDRRLSGAKWLDVGDIAPGEKKIKHVAIYKGLIPPDQMEMYPLPDPQPEDREFYWEFRPPRKT